jgi:hypothetical protein
MNGSTSAARSAGSRWLAGELLNPSLLLVAAITEIVHLLRWDLRVTFSVTVLVMMLVCMLGYSPPSRTWHDKRNETDAVVSCAPACRGGSDSP